MADHITQDDVRIYFESRKWFLITILDNHKLESNLTRTSETSTSGSTAVGFLDKGL